MPDADRPAKKNVAGIEGWLLLYMLGPGIVGTLWALIDAIMLGVAGPAAYRLIYGALLVANYFGVFMILVVWKPITRTYHIWLNIISAGFIVFTIVEIVDWRGSSGVVIGVLIWASYWIMSKRVRATYCQQLGQGTSSD